jgi:hypothetical protein
MLDRIVSARTLIIIGVRVGVFRDVTLLHWWNGFRRVQKYRVTLILEVCLKMKAI